MKCAAGFTLAMGVICSTILMDETQSARSVARASQQHLSASEMRGCYMLIGDRRLKIDSILWGVTRADVVGVAMLTGEFEDGETYESINLNPFSRLLESTDEFTDLLLPAFGSGEFARVERYELMADEAGDLLLSRFVGVIDGTTRKLIYVATDTDNWADCCKWRTGIKTCIGDCSVPCPQHGKSCGCTEKGDCIGSVDTICAGNCRGGSCLPGTCASRIDPQGMPRCNCRGT